MALQTFFYDGDDDIENMCMYKQGGYHPVLLGDVLPKKSASGKPRYRIMQKFGHGAFATVWLARDLLGQFGYVALKINVSSITGKNNETRILRWLKDSTHNQSGYQNTMHLLDDFVLEGPNGSHECLVTEVVGSMNEFKFSSGFGAHTKEISFQMLNGLAYLHSQGVAHGDLHSGNLGIGLPQLNDHSEERIMEYFSNPECVVVVPRNPQDANESLPAYLVSPISIMNYLTKKTSIQSEPVHLKIMDFGNSFRKEDERPPPNTPISIRAPEVTFCELSRGKVGSDWNQAADVWAAACTIYELNFGNVMLYGVGRGDAFIHQTIQLAGTPPPAWQQYWDMEKYCEGRSVSRVIDTDAFWANRRSRRIKKDPSDPDLQKDTDELIDLLRQMLRIDPEERPQVEGLLSHPWFANIRR